MISARQRRQRRKHVGSSDAPAIVGVCPWRSPMDVYLSKISDLDEAPSPAMEVGNVCEPGLLQWWAAKHGLKCRRNLRYVAADGINAANTDGVACDPETQRLIIVEAKTTASEEHWRDGIPANVLAQVLHQFYCCRAAAEAWVVVNVANREIREFPVNRAEHVDTIEGIGGACVRFWLEHVEKRQPPEGAASVELLKRIRREPGSTAVVDVPAIVRWENLRALRLAVEKLEADAQAQVLTQLGTAEADAQGNVTYMPTTRKSLDIPRLEREHPEICRAYTREKTFRTLRARKPEAAIEFDPDSILTFIGEAPWQKLS
jgi:putative phage-type endonuclease